MWRTRVSQADRPRRVCRQSLRLETHMRTRHGHKVARFSHPPLNCIWQESFAEKELESPPNKNKFTLDEVFLAVAPVHSEHERAAEGENPTLASMKTRNQKKRPLPRKMPVEGCQAVAHFHPPLCYSSTSRTSSKQARKFHEADPILQFGPRIGMQQWWTELQGEVEILPDSRQTPWKQVSG